MAARADRSGPRACSPESVSMRRNRAPRPKAGSRFPPDLFSSADDARVLQEIAGIGRKFLDEWPILIMVEEIGNQIFRAITLFVFRIRKDFPHRIFPDFDDGG